MIATLSFGMGRFFCNHIPLIIIRYLRIYKWPEGVFVWVLVVSAVILIVAELYLLLYGFCFSLTTIAIAFI